MYRLEYNVTTSNTDENGNLKLFSALQMMQDCSELWMDSEPFVKHYFDSHNMAQLLAFRQVDVVRVPMFKEKLCVETSVYEMMGKFGYRNTIIYDSLRKPCYLCWCMGVFVDKITGRLTNVPIEVANTLKIEPMVNMEYCDKRIIFPKDNIKTSQSVDILKNDIDYNHHVNNANFVRIALEFLPNDFIINRLRVEFKHPAVLGQKLIPEFVGDNQSFYVRLSADDKVCAVMNFEK